jgi:thiol-disulfide isomerase/thioredoxin
MNMLESFGSQKFSRAAKLVFLLTSAVGLVLSIVSMMNVCTNACSEVSLYKIFGVQFGWFGIMFFATLLGLLGLNSRFVWAGLLYVLLVFAATGAELRLIWLQKYVIGTWCPLCLAIASVVFLAFVVILFENRKSLPSETRKMKTFLMFTAVLAFSAVIGLSGAILGVKGQAEAQEPNLYLGKTDSATVVYFVSDWFCPACRKAEPIIEKLYPKIAEFAKVAFVDIPVHPETSNFTPYNLQFLLYDKEQYIQLRRALDQLAKKNAAPTAEDVQAAVAPYDVKLRNMSYAEILSGLKWNENVCRTFGIRATPTVVVSNAKTGKHVNLVGTNKISYEAILKAADEVGK